jgi:hypothetical protein
MARRPARHHANTARLSSSQGVDLGVFRKTSELLFGEDELVVDGDLEDPAGTFNEFDFGAVFFFKPRPRTEGSG